MDSSHDIVPTLRMFDGVMVNKAADEIEALRARLDVSFAGGTMPSHYCKVCGAMWRKWGDGSWNLRSKQCGKCCDNAPMGDQILPMTDYDPAPVKPAESGEAPAHVDPWHTLETVTQDFQELLSYATGDRLTSPGWTMATIKSAVDQNINALIAAHAAPIDAGAAKPAEWNKDTEAVLHTLLSEEQISAIAHACEQEAIACPGTNMWMVAQMAVERAVEEMVQINRLPSMQIAEVWEDADGTKHIEPVIEDLDDLPKGLKLYAGPRVTAAPIGAGDAESDADDYLRATAEKLSDMGYLWQAENLRRAVGFPPTSPVAEDAEISEAVTLEMIQASEMWRKKFNDWRNRLVTFYPVDAYQHGVLDGMGAALLAKRGAV